MRTLAGTLVVVIALLSWLPGAGAAASPEATPEAPRCPAGWTEAVDPVATPEAIASLQLEATESEPRVDLCASTTDLVVGEEVTVVARLVNLGIPLYVLELQFC